MEVTWWGHATCTIEDSGVRVLTDPLFVRRFAHLRRRRGEVPPPQAALAEVVLVSHLHSDHLHLPSLARLSPGTRLIVPGGAVAAVPGLRSLHRKLDLRITEVRAGDEVRVGEVRVRAVPALHDGRRLPVGPRRVPALGYVVEGEARTYFAGDTGLYDEMGEAVGAVDVALLPVGGWGPYLGHGHLDASRAAQALRLLEPRSAVPVHFGTYWPIGLDGVRPHEFHGPGDEFVRQAGLRAPEVAVHLLSHGEQVRPEAER
ncbi:MBL fold metallo-hydrolase [Streptomyces sp. OUCMDZ-4982]|uniref:MBL fold metallo-hydrolase n=1 Tax=Streptomyces sp. OUCMDZ-4982 TaxID=2973090 RepID=UPI00215BAD0A|nr:MBL fold metallo-hydrolase [Streptomyces sp. OUCMDZ-4982]MCR8943284.1 MBL fold metallo-hydrolase [Streptomyces sp. OUCMDZ-4982]